MTFAATDEPTEEPQDDGSCLTACGLDERCAKGNCVSSDNWLVAEATLRAPDGSRHHFTALSDSLALSCAMAAGDQSDVSRSCKVAFAPTRWRESDLDAGSIRGVLPSDWVVDIVVTTEGTLELGACPLSSVRNADEFTLSDGTCSATVTDMLLLGDSGYVKGTFFARANVASVSDAGGAGVYLMRGEFQVAF